MKKEKNQPPKELNIRKETHIQIKYNIQPTYCLASEIIIQEKELKLKPRNLKLNHKFGEKNMNNNPRKNHPKVQT